MRLLRKGTYKPLGWLLSATLVVLFLFVAGCAGARRIAVEVDGSRRILETQEETVREALESEGVTLGALDRTQPPLWEPIPDGMTIIVTRGREQTEVETTVLPFTRQVMRDEALEEGEHRP